MGYVKDLDLAVPLRKEVRWRDPRTKEIFEGWEVAVEDLDENMWTKIYADCAQRFPDTPASLHNFRAAILEQGGIPIRAERVQVVYDIRGFRKILRELEEKGLITQGETGP